MNRKKLALCAAAALVAIAALIFALQPRYSDAQKAFADKAGTLKDSVVTDETIDILGTAPAGAAGHAVFFSVCDGDSRARVYNGTGKSLSAAWKSAVRNTMNALEVEPLWVRVDVVSHSWPATEEDVANELYGTLSGFDFNGLSLDEGFETALPEGEMNGWAIYDYDGDLLSLDHLNGWLRDTGRESLTEFPGQMVSFECRSWFCDADSIVYPLYYDGADASRRQVDSLDADYAKGIIDTASSFLMNQVRDDGTFIYGINPQFDGELDHYNILRHSGTIWSLVCRYRMFPNETLRALIERTIEYMLSQIRYDGSAGYIYDQDDDEFKIGGNGIAIVALTEYMDVFGDDRYTDACVALGEGILSRQEEDGGYWHVLNGDFSEKEAFRTVYYDGECTFALTRLYGLTGEQKWLDAACRAIDHFIDKDYTQYRDHWVAYSLNEVTKYVERQDYYDFALANAVNNYERIEGRPRTYPTNLELLIASFESYQRMMERGVDIGDFDAQKLLDVIYARANRQLSGYFYPELAMYMANPRRVVGSFMTRNDAFRVRIDDVQHNIGGYYLYWKNYDAMLKAGLRAM